jgi:hypothetical protein
MSEWKITELKQLYLGNWKIVAEENVESDTIDSTQACPTCGGTMTAIRCKLKCLTCGFQLDCSDL